MAAHSEISQRDLRTKSKQIMDAVERGETFTVTRGGRPIGELVPLRRPRRWVPSEDFVAASRDLPYIDPDRFRADVDAAVDQSIDYDPFDV